MTTDVELHVFMKVWAALHAKELLLFINNRSLKSQTDGNNLWGTEGEQ